MQCEDFSQQNLEMKDSYEEFLYYFNISKDQFYKYGISSIIFSPNNTAEKLWIETKEKLINNRKISIRGYGRNGKGSELFIELYKYIFGNNNISVDPTNNSIPRKVIQEATRYKINSNLFNYQCSHIWGNTKNPLLFEAAWNICLIPRIFDPLTGHECKKGWNIEFSKILQGEAYNRFKSIIEDYNKFIDNEDIISKINSFSNKLDDDIKDKFLIDALNEWKYINIDKD